METIKVESEFVDYIRELVCDRLDEFECVEHDGVCASDLRWELMVDEDHDNMFTEDEAFDFLRRFPSASLAAVDYSKSNFGSEDLPYMLKDWPTFAVRVVLFGVECMVCSLPLVDEKWNADDDEIEFDHDTVELLKEQVATAGIEY